MGLFWNLHRTSQVSCWSFTGFVTGTVKNVSDNSCLPLGKEFISRTGEGRGLRTEVSSKVKVQVQDVPDGKDVF